MLPEFIRRTILRWASWAWNKWNEYTKTVEYVDRKINNAGFTVTPIQKDELIGISKNQVDTARKMQDALRYSPSTVFYYQQPGIYVREHQYDVIVTITDGDGMQKSMPITIRSDKPLSARELYDKSLETLSSDIVNRDKYNIKSDYVVVPNKFYVLRTY